MGRGARKRIAEAGRAQAGPTRARATGPANTIGARAAGRRAGMGRAGMAGKARQARRDPARSPGARRPAPPLALFLALAGCGGAASPSTPLFGAYFPSWLICGAIGVLGSAASRALFIRLGIDEGLPLRSLVYICLALLIAFATAIALYGR